MLPVTLPPVCAWPARAIHTPAIRLTNFFMTNTLNFGFIL
jgi:hypothetical protein